MDLSSSKIVASMVEKSNVRKCHSDIVLVASFYNIVVANGAACLRDKFDARFMSAFDIVAEWEEGIRRKRHPAQIF